jgi:hypothetical protein
MKDTTAAVLAMLAVLHALTVLLSANPTPLLSANPTPHSVLASNEQRIADSGSLFIGTIILRWQRAMAQRRMAEAEAQQLAQERDRVLLEARTREAERARELAELRAREAQQARQGEQVQAREAELARDLAEKQAREAEMAREEAVKRAEELELAKLQAQTSAGRIQELENTAGGIQGQTNRARFGADVK